MGRFAKKEGLSFINPTFDMPWKTAVADYARQSLEDGAYYKLCKLLEEAEYLDVERKILCGGDWQREAWHEYKTLIVQKLGKVFIQTKMDYATAQASAYANSFSIKAVLGKALVEGWGQHLYTYIANTARTQAMMMLGMMACYELPAFVEHGNEERKDKYLDFCRKCAAERKINVPVGEKVLSYFKELSENQRNKTAMTSEKNAVANAVFDVVQKANVGFNSWYDAA